MDDIAEALRALPRRSRPLRHPQLLPIIGHTAQRLGITLDLI